MSSSDPSAFTQSNWLEYAPEAAPLPSLLDTILDAADAFVPASVRQASHSSTPVGEVAASDEETVGDPMHCLVDWLQQRMAAHHDPSEESPLAAELARLVSVLIARIDRALQDQVNQILHHPRFQQLESSWRGLSFLIERQEAALNGLVDANENVRIAIQVLSISKRELYSDLTNAMEFDQSQVWRKIYESGFGTAGAMPFSAIVGDYRFANNPMDLQTLEAMSEVAAASFAPFVTASMPDLLGVESYEELQMPLDDRVFQRPDYIKWQQLRKHPDSRFLGMVVPQVLMRPPHDYRNHPQAGKFRFQEDVSGADSTKLLWGNGAYAFASVLMRSFADSGWFSDIRGVAQGIDGGGLVTGLPTHRFSTDQSGMAIKSSLNVVIDDVREGEFSSVGMIPLCQSDDAELAVFYTNQSVHSPEVFDDDVKTANERMSSMLQYVLCTSRFAHYLKSMARQFLGSMKEASEIQQELSAWIHQYVNPDEKAAPDIKARYPLREAEILVNQPLDHPGRLDMSFRLLPHFQLEAMAASVTLRTSIIRPGS